MILKLLKRLAMASLLLAACTPAATAYSTSYYTTVSRLSHGHWVKIATDSEGIHQLTYDRLRELGFSDPSKVQVYGCGALKFTTNQFATGDPDDLQPAATLHTADGRILFFGQSATAVTTNSSTGYDANVFNIYKNLYDTRSYYFLSDYEGTADIPAKQKANALGSLAPASSHIHLETVEYDDQTPINGGIGYHGHPVEGGSVISTKFHVRNFSPTPSQALGSFYYNMALSSSTSLSLSTRIDSDVDSVYAYDMSSWAISDGDFTYYNEVRGYLSFGATDTEPLAERDITFDIMVPRSEALRYAAPDRIVCRYPRANVLDAADPALVFNFARSESYSGQKVIISEVADPADIHVWSIDNPSQIKSYPTDYDADSRQVSFVLCDNSTRRVVAFDASATYAEPQIVGDVAAQNIHGDITPHMLIITTAEYYDIALELARAHRQYQGLDVNVFTHDQIFNEFSSGARDIMGYRRLAKMYYDRRPSKFKYVVLLGPCNYDNRCIEVPQADRLLTYQNTNPTQTRNTITNYTSDAIVGMLANDYNHDQMHQARMQVAVGRIPATNPAQARSYVDKVVDRLRHGPDYSAYSRAMLIAGEGDRNTHLSHSVEVADSMRKARPDLTFVNLPCQLYEDPDRLEQDRTPQRPLVVAEMQRGLGYLTYSGHGDPNYIGNLHLIDKSVATSTDYDHKPFVMLSSCDQFAFDRQQNGLIETMLFSPGGGILCGVGAARGVYITHNQTECVPVAQAYAMAGPDDTFGTVYLKARDMIIDKYRASNGTMSSNALVNCLSYNFAGDPAIPVGAPGYLVDITEIDGRAVEDNIVEIKPLTPVRIKAAVKDAKGEAASAFNGVATVRILAPAVTSPTYDTNKEDGYKPMDITQQFDILVETTTAVAAGMIDCTVTMPAPVNTGANRIVVTACDPDGDNLAMGTTDLMETADYNPADFADVSFEAPSIVDFRVGGEDFTAGGEVATDATVTAVIDPSATGLAMATGGVGSRTSLTLDNITDMGRLERFMILNDNGTYTLSVDLPDVRPGLHSLALCVVNNAGLSARSTIEFMATEAIDRPALTVESDVARNDVVIDLDTTDGDNRLVILDSHGNTVFSADNVAFPYRWDLTTNAGAAVTDGRYKATLLVSRGLTRTHATEATFTVIR